MGLWWNVGNFELPLDQCWNIYNERADCENCIKELKIDFGLECFCLKGFWATEVSSRCTLGSRTGSRANRRCLEIVLPQKTSLDERHI